jgi:hypothetical protein
MSVRFFPCKVYINSSHHDTLGYEWPLVHCCHLIVCLVYCWRVEDNGYSFVIMMITGWSHPFSPLFLRAIIVWSDPLLGGGSNPRESYGARAGSISPALEGFNGKWSWVLVRLEEDEQLEGTAGEFFPGIDSSRDLERIDCHWVVLWLWTCVGTHKTSISCTNISSKHIK